MFSIIPLSHVIVQFLRDYSLSWTPSYLQLEHYQNRFKSVDYIGNSTVGNRRFVWALRTFLFMEENKENETRSGLTQKFLYINKK